jgi:hypothetical protein
MEIEIFVQRDEKLEVVRKDDGFGEPRRYKTLQDCLESIRFKLT